MARHSSAAQQRHGQGLFGRPQANRIHGSWEYPVAHHAARHVRAQPESPIRCTAWHRPRGTQPCCYVLELRGVGQGRCPRARWSTWSLGVPYTGGRGGASGAATVSAAATGSGAGHAGGERGRAEGAGPGPSSTAAAAGGTSRWAAVSGAAGGGPVTAGLPPRNFTTETQSNYGPPPPDFRRTRSAGASVSQMVPPSYPNDWKTTKQVEYRPEVVAGAPPPPPPFRAPGSGPLLPSDVPPNSQFVSQHRTHFAPGRSLRDSQALRPSGCAATQAASYNIITGSAMPYTNNAFEAWDGRDYRRHR